MCAYNSFYYIVFYKPDQEGPIKLPGLDDADIGLSGTLGSAAKYLWAAGLLAGNSIEIETHIYIYIYIY